EIKARGETPVELVVEPSGAEFAQPERSFSVEEVVKENPDPEALIDRDELGFIDVKIVVVPSEVKPGGAVRVHVLMTPNTDTKVKAHWNNEADDTVLWIDPLDAWQVDRRWLSAKRPETIVSTETRRIEFELHLPDDAKAGVAKIPAYALYYVCEDVSGLCLYRRQDLEIKVNVVK
ncbi:MAG: hypothetical protein O7G85_02180, partial [Planctomycetota bacterium]|nr:hypothetical protein [Planctomycetota bacterium]